MIINVIHSVPLNLDSNSKDLCVVNYKTVDFESTQESQVIGIRSANGNYKLLDLPKKDIIELFDEVLVLLRRGSSPSEIERALRAS